MTAKQLGCPCCEERVGKRGGFRFMLKCDAPIDACVECVIDDEKIRYDADLYPPFRWPRTPESIAASAKTVVADTEQTLANVVSASTLDFNSVVLPLMKLPCYKTNPLVCQNKHLQHCSTDPVIREAASKAATEFANCKKKTKTRKDVYEKVVSYAATEEYKTLSVYNKHFVDAIIGMYERAGLSLSTENAAELSKLLDADVDCCNRYKKNLGEDKTSVEFSPEELKGCDAEWIKERTKENNTVTLTLKYPDLLPVLQNCEVGETRKKLTLARERAYGNNLDLVAEGINYRQQVAKILEFASWAHLVTQTRMSGNPEKVHKFLAEIREKALPGAKRDYARLLALKKTHLGLPETDSSADLEAWDVSFYHSLLLKTEYGVDHEEIRQYFPADNVIKGTLQIYQDLLSLQFTELEDFDTWHEEVRLFVVHDRGGTKERVGHFYLDLHPREGKYGHAAIFHLLKRTETQTPVDCMLCNLPAPNKTTGKPALLRHDDVVTFFHEFGHIMHGLCAEGIGNATTLAKCPRDFVEAPSQMLENWCFNEKVLQILSKHVETSETLPSSLIEKLLKAKNVSEGLMMSRQVYLATLDLTIHGAGQLPQSADELQALVDKMRPEISLIKNPASCNMLRNFGHLMNQYSAAYYGYLWAEVLSADMFASKFEKNPFDQEAGMEYRKKVLGVGGTGKIADHLVNFLGHEPSQDPFLKSRGIL
ncbi:unnamed protein product [Amoebophrya sp. A120]|nr:unnamed protein product [Amoebophrya sp. A120]|eukprot:GSA120T00002124001.1